MNKQYSFISIIVLIMLCVVLAAQFVDSERPQTFNQSFHPNDCTQPELNSFDLSKPVPTLSCYGCAEPSIGPATLALSKPSCKDG